MIGSTLGRRGLTRLAVLGIGAALAVVPGAAGRALGQNQPADPPHPGIEPTAVAATVEGSPILVGEVARTLRAAVAKRAVNPAALIVMQAQVLDQLVDRRIVQTYLDKNGIAATTGEIDQAIDAFKAKLAAQKLTLQNVLKEQGLTEDDLRAQAAWELSWKRYLVKHLTDDALERYFEEHRKEFDGSKIQASHILLRPPRSGDGTALAALVAQAQDIRRQIVSGEINFEEAARRYSAGPSRHNGGQLGSFPRHGVMLEPFSRAAFALDVGGLSQPVHTRFGVHLIYCTGVEPGDKQWTDVRDQLEPPVTQDLFTRLAQQQRPTADVKFTGVLPYVDPQTHKLVAPGG